MQGIRGTSWVGLFVLSVWATGCGGDTPPAGDAGPRDATIDDVGPQDGGAGDASVVDGGPLCGANCSGPPIPLDEIRDVVERDVCTALVTCGISRHVDVDHCVRDQELRYSADFTAAVANQWLSYDADAAGACHAFATANPCALVDYFLWLPDIYDLFEVCAAITGQPIIVGEQAVTAPCSSDVHCTSGGYCEDGAACPGVCAALGAVGAGCGWEGECQADLVCIDDLCATPVAAGQPCSSVFDCAGELTCTGSPRVCTPRAIEGASCLAADCDYDLICDDGIGGPGVCIQERTAGESCTGADCAWPLHCYRTVGTTVGTCIPERELGMSCASDGRLCAGDLRCVNEVCTAPGTQGDSCFAGFGGDDCADGFRCISNVCYVGRAYGEACNDGVGACLEGLCRNDVCVPRFEVGETCSSNDDCTTRECAMSVCVDPLACQ